MTKFRYILALCAALLLTTFTNVTAQLDAPQSLNIELLAYLDPEQDKIPKHNYNDIWGYTADGREYAIMGALDGTWFIDVTDARAPRVVQFFEGPNSLWRDIKTHETYAYVVHETMASGEFSNGIHVYDLSGLPESVEFVGAFLPGHDEGTWHNLYIEDGLAYLAGGSRIASLSVLDLQNPREPELYAVVGSDYWHDVVVNNGLAFGSALASGIQIWDVRDFNNSEAVLELNYPGAFTHNMWPTPDNQFLVTTDEKFRRPLRFWDISDVENPEQTAQYDIGSRSVAHNAHILGDYAYVSFYYDGLKIFDISDRRAPYEVAWYDTFPDETSQRSTGFDGAWGVYPNLPSGNILVSDKTYGLFVLEFNNAQAATMHGIIREAESGAPISGVELTTLNVQTGTGEIRINNSAADGSYRFSRRGGTVNLQLKKVGYETLTLEDLEFNAGATIERDIELVKLKSGTFRIVLEDENAQRLPGINIDIRSVEFGNVIKTRSDGNGEAEDQVFFGDYEISVKHWGHYINRGVFTVRQSEVEEFRFVPDPVYLQPFNEEENWSMTAAGGAGPRWSITQGEKLNAFLGLPVKDYDGNAAGNFAYRPARMQAHVMTSPVFDVRRMQEPLVQFERYYLASNYELFDDADDTLQILLSDGVQWHVLAEYTNVQDSEWKQIRLPIKDFVEAGDNMQVAFRIVEGDRQNRPSDIFRRPVYAAIDEVAIMDAEFDLTAAFGPLDGGPDPGDQTPATLFDVRPNPVGADLTLLPQVAGAARVTIRDVRGQKFLSRTVALEENEALRLDVARLASGTCFVHLELESGESHTVQIVVQR